MYQNMQLRHKITNILVHLLNQDLERRIPLCTTNEHTPRLLWQLDLRVP